MFKRDATVQRGVTTSCKNI